MSRRLVLVGVAVGVLLTLAGCAAAPNDVVDAVPSAPGFWLGLWHGLILPVTLVLSLLRDDVGVYAVHNDGAAYDIGFFLGICATFGGAHHPFVQISRTRTTAADRQPRQPPPGDLLH